MDWSYLSQQFGQAQHSRDSFVGNGGAVVWSQYGDSRERWETHNFITGQARFTELAVTAGQYLIASNVTLLNEIEQEPDDFARWCRFLQSEFPARFRMEQPIQLELSNDGIQTTQWLLRGYIRQVEQVSVSACERLAIESPPSGIANYDDSMSHGGDNIPQTTTELKPVVLLTGWREITSALELKSDEQSKVKSLNDRMDGPIPKPPKGGQPIVEKTILIAWWNSLAVKQQELANQQSGKKLSAESQHDSGRDGTAAPEIKGGVKKRRRDHKT
ncbi:hypothetical protein Mal52_30870 [Symmachiella dynata]|uniref:Uncharacterized protein n=1 Tax=Symmachiella dynata TaxID=2527995 RepID=A0A517ZQ51_9PLAN|nr:hypothetical protein [Symmachiella dynata]QDU44601.1 hypothetical protein Mal52_30870 [Symmachiella dynata]